MADEKGIEESLRLCEEIRKQFQHDSIKEEEPLAKEVEERSESVQQEAEKELHLEFVTDEEKKDKENQKRKKKKDQTGEWSDSEYNERHPLLHTLLGVLICVIVAMLLSLLITKYVAHHTSVEGSSMESTLSNGDQLIVEKLSYYFHDPERFDVIVFPYDNNVNYIKRIIGLPGETVQIMDGKIFINGEILNEDYGNAVMEEDGIASDVIQLGDDEYFVLGDNRNASVDSRKEEVGNIKRDKIQGKAWLRFYPFEDFQIIE
ncbi:MAG: signal peptidase I [Eubacterium sp.]|nr:signal peptidase I [Eubacterium sp.]